MMLLSTVVTPVDSHEKVQYIYKLMWTSGEFHQNIQYKFLSPLVFLRQGNFRSLLNGNQAARRMKRAFKVPLLADDFIIWQKFRVIFSSSLENFVRLC